MKKIILVIVAFFAIGMTISTPASAEFKGHGHGKPHKEEHVKVEKAKKVKEEKVKEKKEKKEDKHDKKNKHNKHDKHLNNQLSSIDKQLDKIEGKVDHYQKRLAHLNAPIVEDDKTTSGDTAGVTTKNSADVDTNNDASEEDIEKELEKELRQYSGYLGKFGALENRLNAVSKKLNQLASKGVSEEELQARIDRVNELQNEIDKTLETLTDVQNKVKEKIQKDTKVKKKKPVKAKANKKWKIKFSQKLDKKTLTHLDIVILDSKQNIIETTLSYSHKDKTVTVNPAQPYKVGESYTLYIGKDIQSEKGLNLENSIKMEFVVPGTTT